MKTLILRTFAHSNIWEGNEEICHFEIEQEDQILEWEPGYLSFKTGDFNRAIGIYIEKYFKGYFSRKEKKIVYPDSGSINERIISELELYSVNNNLSFPFYDLKNRICVPIKFVKKLWTNPNKELMLKIDHNLIQAKMEELRKNNNSFIEPKYKPLSFSLESGIVDNILRDTRF